MKFKVNQSYLFIQLIDLLLIGGLVYQILMQEGINDSLPPGFQTTSPGLESFRERDSFGLTLSPNV